MNFPSKHRFSKEGYTTHYVQFDSVEDFHQFIREQGKKLNTSNQKKWEAIDWEAQSKIDRRSDFYGIPVPQRLEDLQKHDQFLGMYLLEKLREQAKKYFEKYLALQNDESTSRPKLAYNAQGLGVFSFDRAILGMHRVQPTVNTPVMQKVINQMRIALDTQNKYTNIKKVYAHFENRKVSQPSLELYIMAGANARVEGEKLLYIGLACSELVTFMEARAIPVAVNVVFGNSFHSQRYMAVVRVKRFEDQLDKNQLLLLSSDPRYFRYRGFQALIALSDYFQQNIPHSLGSMLPNMGKDFIDQITTNQYAVFEQSYSLEKAVQETIDILENYFKSTKK